MRNLSDLITRIRESLKDDEYTKETAASIIQEVTRVSLEGKDMDLKNGDLNITTGAAAKSEIFLKEEKILQKLKESGLPIRKISYR